MARRVNQVENVIFAIFGMIGQGNCIAFDGDTAFPLNIHIVQNLILKIPFIADTGELNQTVGKRGFSVINMGYYAEVSYVFHNTLLKKALQWFGGLLYQIFSDQLSQFL